MNDLALELLKELLQQPKEKIDKDIRYILKQYVNHDLTTEGDAILLFDLMKDCLMAISAKKQEEINYGYESTHMLMSLVSKNRKPTIQNLITMIPPMMITFPNYSIGGHSQVQIEFYNLFKNALSHNLKDILGKKGDFFTRDEWNSYVKSFIFKNEIK